MEPFGHVDPFVVEDFNQTFSTFRKFLCMENYEKLNKKQHAAIACKQHIS